MAVDLPGHGSSDASQDPGRYRIERVVDDLVAVLDELGASEANWVGYSMGGRIALAAAVLCPERVHRLVLESASPGLETEAERQARRAADEALASRLVNEDFEDFVRDWMAKPLFASQAQLGSDWSDSERSRRLRHDPIALAACLRGLGTGSQPSFWEPLANVSRPTLLITGALDPKFMAVGRRMAELLPDAQLAEFDNTGHAVHAEDPVAWTAWIKRFLDG